MCITKYIVSYGLVMVRMAHGIVYFVVFLVRRICQWENSSFHTSQLILCEGVHAAFCTVGSSSIVIND